MNLRIAEISDSDEISGLMNQLGYDSPPELIRTKLVKFCSTPNDIVFVAVIDEKIVGCISCHITSLFHQAGASGRITSLVTNQHYGGKGIGKKLVARAENFFKSGGCIKSEVTSGDQREAAHKFYTTCGYRMDERRFIKEIS
jgi:GNAT superfamily N-acetyltransferase